MKALSCRLIQFRNVEDRTFVPGEGLTVFTGPNGSGKTNVLEAFKSEYNCSMPLLLDSDLGSVLDQCFNMQAMGFNFFNFQQDAPNSGKVICSLVTDEYIRYLLTLHDYFE